MLYSRMGYARNPLGSRSVARMEKLLRSGNFLAKPDLWKRTLSVTFGVLGGDRPDVNESGIDLPISAPSPGQIPSQQKGIGSGA